jgi:hypothetical protein
LKVFSLPSLDNPRRLIGKLGKAAPDAPQRQEALTKMRMVDKSVNCYTILWNPKEWRRIYENIEFS